MKISVITVCYNAENVIRETIESVVSQTYKNYEYILVDGNSSDSTRPIIDEYSEKITHYISESDNGIYDAMNKGVSASTGDYLYFLNAGDVFIHGNVLKLIAEELHKEKPQILFGRGFHYDEDKGSIGLIDYSNNKINKYFLYRSSICQQAFFAHKDLFSQYGSFDTSYRIKGDHEWISRCIIKHEASISKSTLGIVVYLDGGFSATSFHKYGIEEKERIKNNYYSAFEKFLLKKEFLWITRRILY